MPPRLPLPRALRCAATQATRSIGRPPTAASPLASLLAGLSLETGSAAEPRRHASILASISNVRSAVQNRKRVGRGPSSSHGKTSGRGNKGQGQHGKVKPWFQGGQTPLIFVKGRKGFVNHRAPVMSTVNLDRLQEWISAGRIDPTRQITPKELVESGLIGSPKDGVKLLARNADSLTTPVDMVVSRASAAAIRAIEAAGGKVVTRYFTQGSIRRVLRGESAVTTEPLPVGPEHVEPVLAARRRAPFLYRLPDPTSRRDIEYYRDPAHRGYLSHLLKPGESPSLYFRVPAPTRPEKQRASTGSGLEDANRLF